MCGRSLNSAISEPSAVAPDARVNFSIKHVAERGGNQPDILGAVFLPNSVLLMNTGIAYGYD